MLARCLLAVASAAFMTFLTSGRASDACYAMKPSPDASHIRELTFDATKNTLTLAEYGLPLRFYKRWDYCSSIGEPDEKGRFECGYDCNGGRGDIAFKEQDDTILLDSITHLSSREGNGTQLVGQFRLKKVEPEVCKTAEAEVWEDNKRRQRKLGDFDYYVFDLKANLAKLSYLSETPDWLFTENTKAAIQRFQLDVGMTPTGVADIDTQEKLKRRAKIGPSRC